MTEPLKTLSDSKLSAHIKSLEWEIEKEKKRRQLPDYRADYVKAWTHSLKTAQREQERRKPKQGRLF